MDERREGSEVGGEEFWPEGLNTPSPNTPRLRPPLSNSQRNHHPLPSHSFADPPAIPSPANLSHSSIDLRNLVPLQLHDLPSPQPPNQPRQHLLFPNLILVQECSRCSPGVGTFRRIDCRRGGSDGSSESEEGEEEGLECEGGGGRDRERVGWDRSLWRGWREEGD
ncbi:hypothetical protein BDY24DRAFT_400032 [Mrakia frigida]|uniref:uncharacterized protein n=1 Tax=Mrakia frigida TaxID=29902 RepID=UPI003FCC1388